jgi:uncharacterized RmlC-like cupin family protein
MNRPWVVRPADLSPPEVNTPGLQRLQAHADEHVWMGSMRTEPGFWSGWHIHPGHDTFAYATGGRIRVEFGPGGSDAIEAEAGDFLHIPMGVVHREGNPGSDPNQGVIFRVGEGPVVANVDGPDPA